MMKHPGGNPDYQQRYGEFLLIASCLAMT